jgi:Ca-activated chloride channel family protein
MWYLSASGAAPAPVAQKVSTIGDRPLRRRIPTPHTDLRSDVNMVLVPVTVTDARDRPVEHLTAGSFRVFDDDVEQKIVSFAIEEGPVSIGFLIDASRSMKRRMEPSTEAVEQFLATLIPEDEFFLIRLSDIPILITRFTRNPDDVLNSLSLVQPRGWTALHDAICLGVQQMRSARNSRRALFLLTDGADNNSRYTGSEVRALIRESDVRVYSIGIFENPGLLEKLAEDTGGRAYFAHRLKDLPDIVERLGREFRSEYVLGYYSPQHARDGKYHKIRVELLERSQGRPWNVSWRRGYFAPPN